MAFLSPSPIELMMIAVIALIVLGPSRLPEAARSLGKGMREMRSSFQGGGDEDDDDDPGEGRRPQPPGDEPDDDGLDDDASLDGLRDDEDSEPAPRAERESVGAAARS